ncbi:MAG TPA: helical backbone metal receptor [Solimonas sp.]|nr:helical backbone metal receptor [Solimonas sp.]
MSRRVVHGLILLALACGPVMAAPPRVVSLAPHLAELACEAGACGQLVGVVEYTDAPAAAAALPKVGNAWAVNLEVLLSLRPDRVLLWDGGTPAATGQRLRDLGLAVLPVRVQTLDDIGRALEQIGTALGTPQPAQRAAQTYRERLGALRARYRDRPRLRAFYQIETRPAYSIGRTSPLHEALALCGADNVFADLPTVAGPVSTEAVLAARPEVVVHTSEENAAEIERYWAPFARLPAARHRVVVDANLLTRQSPRVLEGIEQLCRGLDAVRASRASR